MAITQCTNVCLVFFFVCFLHYLQLNFIHKKTQTSVIGGITYPLKIKQKFSTIKIKTTEDCAVLLKLFLGSRVEHNCHILIVVV